MQHNQTLCLVIVTGVLITMLIVSTTFSNSVYAQNKFRAKLDANNQVPPVDSEADGVATFKIKEDAVQSTINVTGITDISGAQIFMGEIGQNDDPIVDLVKTGEKIQRPDGVAIKGMFTASEFEGSMQGKDLPALQSAMAANQTFVNVMTSEHPDGEVIGHIYSKGSTTGTQDMTVTSDAITDDENVSEEGTEEDGDDSEDIEVGEDEE